MLPIPALLLSAQTKIFQRLFLPDVRALFEPHVFVPIAGQADQQQAFWCTGRSAEFFRMTSSSLAQLVGINSGPA